MLAKNDMIHAYQERMDHFEKKLSIKDKEIGLLKETITVFSKGSLITCHKLLYCNALLALHYENAHK